MTARAREARRGGFLWGRVARYQEPAIKSNNGIRMMEWEINEYGRRHGRGLRYLFSKSSFGLPVITQQNDPNRQDYEAHGAVHALKSRVMGRRRPRLPEGRTDALRNKTPS